MDHDSVPAPRGRAAVLRAAGPAAAAGRGARDLLGKLDTLHAELERLQDGLQATADRLAARPDGPAR